MNIEGIPEELRSEQSFSAIDADDVNKDFLMQEESGECSESAHIDATGDCGSAIKRMDLIAWRNLIQADAQDIWTSPRSREIWEFSGQSDLDDIAKKWCAYTFVWILGLSKTKEESRVRRGYAKYLKRFLKVRKSLKKKMRAAHFNEGAEKFMHLLDPTVSADAVCQDLAETVGNERESDSLVFHILKQRPDLFVTASSHL